MSKVSFEVRHKHHSHTNKRAVVKACQEGSITFTTKEVKDHHCEACHLAKAKDSIPKKTLCKWYRPLEMVAVDVIGHQPGHLGFRYTTHFVDAATGYHWMKFSREKAAAQSILIEWITQLERQTGLKVQNIGIDGGGEFGQGTQLFSASPIQRYLREKGIILRVTTAETPWYNARIERVGQSITSYARTALLAEHLPSKLWPFAEETAATIFNLLPVETRVQRGQQISRLQDRSAHRTSEGTEHMIAAVQHASHTNILSVRLVSV